MIRFPAGLATRALTATDVDVVTALVEQSERFDDGVAEIDASDVLAHWGRKGMDLATMTIGVFDGDRLVAFGEVFESRAENEVLPAWRGRGIGTALLRWSWDVARAQGSDRVGQTVSDNRTDAAALFAVHGYAPLWTSWVLQIDLKDVPEAIPLPAGYAIRDFEPGRDDRAVYEVIETAFSEWPHRDPLPYESWRALMPEHRAFAPWASALVVEGGRIVGVSIALDYGDERDGWIHQLAVDSRDRGLGLGRALLDETFRRFRDAGRTHGGLSTDSRTGALGLYQRAGMKVLRSYTQWSKSLAG